MPGKTKDNKEIIEKKNSGGKSTGNTKTATKKNSTSSKSEVKATTKKATTNEKKELEKKNNVANKTSKSSKVEKAVKEKKVSNATPKTTTKETTKKTTTAKKTVEKNDVAKKENIKQEETVKEETVIQKIKAFIAKIVAMQEEARLEEEDKNVEKDDKKKKQDEEKPKTPYMLEYYDLPYRYNETVVKILAQTPKRLFVYWDISDSDRQKYILAFGERFFEETYPVLLVHNEDMNYTFEVPINDFANSWYLDINDSKAKYTIQLGRKFRHKPEMVNITSSAGTENIVLKNDYVPIITSNMLEVPNDHILFENISSRVLYRNVKTGVETTVNIDNLEFAKRMGHIYSIYDIYKEIYKNEMDTDSLTSLLNPSSMSSSVFK